MVKFSDLFCNKSLGGTARRFLAPFRRHFDTSLEVFVSLTLDGVTLFFSCQQRKKCMLTNSVTVKTVGWVSLCDDGQLEESEGCNYFFVVFYVLESK